jgi:hypothetical protein
MERVLLYWDDLDDIVGAFALMAERIRNQLLFALSTTCVVGLQTGGIWIALREPPLALAIATILLVTLLYRETTNPR